MYSLTGSVLVAHPVIQDIALKKSVILVGEHADGSISGVQLNDPCLRFLSDVDPEYYSYQFGDIPVYNGGPYDGNMIVLTAWVFNDRAHQFELYYAITPDEALRLKKKHSNIQIRGFLGYTVIPNISQEIDQGFWIVYSAKDLLGMEAKGNELWYELVKFKRPNAII